MASKLTNVEKTAVLKRLKTEQRGVKDAFLDRAIERGITSDDIDWNIKLGRPLHWIETQDPEAEVERRKEYTARVKV